MSECRKILRDWLEKYIVRENATPGRRCNKGKIVLCEDNRGCYDVSIYA